MLRRLTQGRLAFLEKDKIVSSFRHRQKEGEEEYHDHQPFRDLHVYEPTSGQRPDQDVARQLPSLFTGLFNPPRNGHDGGYYQLTFGTSLLQAFSLGGNAEELRLTLAQRATLRAVVLAGGREILSADLRARYRLGGASSVQTALQALVREDLITREADRYTVVDSLMREWIARKTF